MTDTELALIGTMAHTRIEMASGRIKLKRLTRNQLLVRDFDLLLIEEPRTWEED